MEIHFKITDNLHFIFKELQALKNGIRNEPLPKGNYYDELFVSPVCYNEILFKRPAPWKGPELYLNQFEWFLFYTATFDQFNNDSDRWEEITLYFCWYQQKWQMISENSQLYEYLEDDAIRFLVELNPEKGIIARTNFNPYEE